MTLIHPYSQICLAFFPLHFSDELILGNALFEEVLVLEPEPVHCSSAILDLVFLWRREYICNSVNL